MRRFLLGIIGIVGLLGCSRDPENPTMVEQLPEIYPDYIGVTIPADIAPLNFNCADEDIDCMDVVARGSKGGEIHTNGDWADFDIKAWQTLTAQNQGGKITITVCTKKDGRWTQYKDFDIYVSKDNLDEW